jgi:hypothetical protein
MFVSFFLSSVLFLQRLYQCCESHPMTFDWTDLLMNRLKNGTFAMWIDPAHHKYAVGFQLMDDDPLEYLFCDDFETAEAEDDARTGVPIQ